MGNLKTRAAEVLLGSALGGGAGFAAEEKDEEGKRRPGRRTVAGAILGAGLSSTTGDVLRKKKLGYGVFEDLPLMVSGDKARVATQMEKGFHPFGIGIQKAASLAEHSVLFDKIADGDLGEEVQHALHGICQAIEVPNNAEKTASVYDVTNLSESDARKARLDQLLKR